MIRETLTYHECNIPLYIYVYIYMSLHEVHITYHIKSEREKDPQGFDINNKRQWRDYILQGYFNVTIKMPYHLDRN